jgi:hypothetical protein
VHELQLCYYDSDEISLPTKCNTSVLDNNEYRKQTFTATCPTCDLHQDCSLSEKSLPKGKQKLRNLSRQQSSKLLPPFQIIKATEQ